MIKNKEMVAAEVYQAVGVLLEDAGRFDTEEGQTLLDACAFLAGNRDSAPTKQLLPFLNKTICPSCKEKDWEVTGEYYVCDECDLLWMNLPNPNDGRHNVEETAAQKANRLAVKQTQTLREVAENRSKSINERKNRS